MGKGEIARNEQFLLFPQCFQKSLKLVIWERVKTSLNNIILDVSKSKADKTSIHEIHAQMVTEVFFERGETVWKKEEILKLDTGLPTFYPFLTIFSKECFLRIITSVDFLIER